MEQNAPDSLFDLQVDYDSGNFLKEASKWTKFIAVVYFVCIGIALLVMLFAGSAIMMTLSSLVPGIALFGAAFMAIMIVALAIGVITAIMLYQFATFTRRGIEQQDQLSFNKGIKALRNYFIIYGVLMMLSLIANLFSFFIKL